MNIVTLIILFGLAGLALFEIYFTGVFINSFRQNKRGVYRDDELSKVAIALCCESQTRFIRLLARITRSKMRNSCFSRCLTNSL